MTLKRITSISIYYNKFQFVTLGEIVATLPIDMPIEILAGRNTIKFGVDIDAVYVPIGDGLDLNIDGQNLIHANDYPFAGFGNIFIEGVAEMRRTKVLTLDGTIADIDTALSTILNTSYIVSHSVTPVGQQFHLIANYLGPYIQIDNANLSS